MSEPDEGPVGEQGLYGLVMPFLPVKSKGGPYDDEAYVGGYEMGVLATALKDVRPQELEQLLHTPNLEQADLIAMRFGYEIYAQHPDEDGWTYIRMRKVNDGPDKGLREAST